jgi:hypothetical protein
MGGRDRRARWGAALMVKIKVRLGKLIETYRHQLLEFGAINPGDVDDALLQRWQEDQGANEALDALAQIVSRMEEIKKKAGNDVKPDFQIEIAAFLIPHILSASHVAKVEDQRSSDLV